jgi:peptidyl-prolyl cis-trans isomerase D
MTSQDPHPFIRQIPGFRDQQTGQFNPALVTNFLNMLEDQDPETRRQWYMLEQEIKKDRIRTKYYNLIQKGYYIPGPMAAEFYEQQAKKAQAVLVGVRYRSIPDSVITITDEDYQAYYDDNKNQFENTDPMAKITYVTFDVNPSKGDYSKILDEAREYYQELEKANKSDVPMLVNTVGNNNYDSTYKAKGELPLRIDTTFFSANAEPGDMVPVYQDGGAFHMARLMDITMRPDSLRASHILINYSGAARAENATRVKPEAKALADSLFQVIQNNPSRFEDFATNVSDDAVSAKNNGDLKWFADGAMTGPFNEGVINHEVGEYFQVETAFGYHIVKVTGKKNPGKKIRVAQLEIPIEATQETIDSVWAQASQFAGSYRSAEAFDNAVREQQLEPRQRMIRPMEGDIPGVGSSRELARWAFDEKTEEGAVSEKAFEGDNTFVVVLLEEKTEAGILPLDKVKEQMKTLVAREVKAKTLKEQFNKQLQNNSDLRAVARGMGVELDTLENISFATYNIQKFGPEPALVGSIMSAEPGKINGPVQGRMGVYVFNVLNIIPAPETDNYARIRQQKQSNFNRQVVGRNGMGQVFQALKDVSDIEDNRILYY